MAEVKEQKKKRKLNRDPIGDSGLTEGFASKFSLEFRQELQGRQGSINYQKMVTSDLQTGMISKVYKNPIKSCKWDIAEIENPTKQEEQAVKLLKSWFFKDNKTQFKTLINQILSMLDYGFSVFELIFTDYVLDGNVYIVPKLKQRLQISIDEIEPENQIVKQIKTSTSRRK